MLTPNRSGWQIGSWSYNYGQVTMSSVEHLYDVYLQPEQGSTWGACRAKGDAGREEISPVCPSVLAQEVDHKESSLQGSLSGVCAHPLEVGCLIFTVQLEGCCTSLKLQLYIVIFPFTQKDGSLSSRLLLRNRALGKYFIVVFAQSSLGLVETWFLSLFSFTYFLKSPSWNWFYVTITYN